MRNSRFARSTFVALALTSLIATVAFDFNSAAFARGTAGATGANGPAGAPSGGSPGGSTSGGGGDNPIRSFSVYHGGPPPVPFHVWPRFTRIYQSCWKMTAIYDGAGDSLGTIPRQECYAK